MRTEPFTVRVSGTVNVDEVDYDYTAVVNGEDRTWREAHSYGSTVAHEVMGERECSDVDIVTIEPDSESMRVIAAIMDDAKEKAENV